MLHLEPCGDLSAPQRAACVVMTARRVGRSACVASLQVARAVEERIGRLMGSPPHELDGGIKLAQTRMHASFGAHHGAEDGVGAEGGARDGAASPSRVPDGVHVDTNRHEHRCAHEIARDFT